MVLAVASSDEPTKSPNAPFWGKWLIALGSLGALGITWTNVGVVAAVAALCIGAVVIGVWLHK